VDAVLGLVLLHLFVKGRAFAWGAGIAAAVLVAIGVGVQLDPRKMTAGVFRHGELASSHDARILFAKDGKTATVHLVQYPEATSLRTNGKSDGSIVMDPAAARGSDEITMVLTAAIPLALNPDIRRAAVIGIGTGLTTHTLLQSLAIERVDTVEIEAAMAEASRGFMPRNSGTFADPRGTILIDDAKSYFSARGARYDLIVSEPSNPWVSGVSSLFTREFYRRIRGHLEPGGLLVQWFQLYEIDASLVASVMGALGAEFPHYAVFAPSDHDLLIVAGNRPLPLPAQARVFEQPGVAKELWTVHVLSAGDIDARYLGSRALLEPLFASYGVAPNSDYAPLLDLNAARHRFAERSATALVGLLNLDVPVLEMLEPEPARRAINPLFQGADGFERIENARLAWYARDFLLGARRPVPEDIPTSLQKDLDLVRVRLIECREPRDFDVWLHAALRVAALVNPNLGASDAVALWARVQAGPCYPTLKGRQREWITLLRAVGARDAQRMAQIAEAILTTEPGLAIEAREYLLMAAMTGRLASREPDAALRLWSEHRDRVRDGAPAFRLLRCRAESSGCAAQFAAYAEH
jgi:spermidine synthase